MFKIIDNRNGHDKSDYIKDDEDNIVACTYSTEYLQNNDTMEYHLKAYVIDGEYFVEVVEADPKTLTVDDRIIASTFGAPGLIEKFNEIINEKDYVTKIDNKFRINKTPKNIISDFMMSSIEVMNS